MRRGFTLIELIISIALVLILMLGINAVFKYTTEAVGTGQAIGAATRDQRAIQAVFAKDFAAYVPNGASSLDSACTIITSSAMPMFRDRADEAGDKGVGVAPANTPRQLTRDIDGNGIEGESNVPGEITSPAVYNARNHRTDTLSFFARDLFQRQTGNDGIYVADMRSQEAWIWYGHLWLPNGANPPAWSNATFAGASNSSALNPNNYYSTQSVLGRVATLLVHPDPATGIIHQTANPPYPPGDDQRYIQGPGQVVATGSVLPLAITAKDDFNRFFIYQSRYDLAGTTIDEYRQNITNAINAGVLASPWWSFLTYNFQCEPFIVRQPDPLGKVPPISSENMARAHPYLVRGCSQFMVEFAGDFVQQNLDPIDADGRPAQYTGNAASPGASDGTYGDVLSNNPDGVIDFAVDKSQDLGFVSPANNNVGASPSLWKRKVRWYGLPRDDNGDGVVQGFRPGVPANRMVDVVPVRDVVRSCIYNNQLAFNGFAWEHFTTVGNPAGVNTIPTPGGSGDYAGPTGLQPKNAGSPTLTPTYIVAMGPNDPRIKMIRITVVITDANGRIPDGQIAQYVFALP